MRPSLYPIIIPAAAASPPAPTSWAFVPSSTADGTGHLGNQSATSGGLSDGSNSTYWVSGSAGGVTLAANFDAAPVYVSSASVRTEAFTSAWQASSYPIYVEVLVGAAWVARPALTFTAAGTATVALTFAETVSGVRLRKDATGFLIVYEFEFA